jgi:hypothetical protein
MNDKDAIDALTPVIRGRNPTSMQTELRLRFNRRSIRLHLSISVSQNALGKSP